MGKRGPKPWQPSKQDLEQIEKLYANGFSKKMIAREVGVSFDTFIKNEAAKEAIDNGKELERSIFMSRSRKLVMQDDNLHVAASMLKWNMSVRHGVSENHKVTVDNQNTGDPEQAVSNWLNTATEDKIIAAELAALESLDESSATPH